ncbi:MAG: hypothetical protein JKY41_12910 [Rhodobacteraceae bacterium]|nr:hypothetical protein [Paracoccaceae bacterium]
MVKWLFVFMCLASPAYPMTGRQALEILDNENGNINGLYLISGFMAGFTWSNSWVELNGGKKMFCIPGELAIVVDQAVDIFRQELGINPDSVEDPAGLVMLLGLQRVFPCQ